MLRNRCDDRNVPGFASEDMQRRDWMHSLLGVASVPERVEPTSPGSNPPFHRQDDNPSESDNPNPDQSGPQEEPELFRGNVRANQLGEGDQLQQPKYAQGGHMLRCPHGLKADERHLHRGEGTNRVPAGVGDIEPGRKAAHEDEHKGVQRDHIGNEDVSSPRCDHIEVEDGGNGAVECRTLLHGTDPGPECEHEEEDSDRLVVVGSGNGTGDIAGYNTH